MIKVDLVWHTDGEDVDLGPGYFDALPSTGDLVTFSAPPVPHIVWRVTFLLTRPARTGSVAAATAQVAQMFSATTAAQVGTYTAFVEPAEGLFHP